LLIYPYQGHSLKGILANFDNWTKFLGGQMCRRTKMKEIVTHG